MVEHRIVDPGVVGSSPTSHPITQCGPLAQLVEQLTLNQWVEGSNPLGPTIFFLLLITQHIFSAFQNEGKLYFAKVAELADAPDLGSGGQPWGFESPPSHQARLQ